MKQFSLSMVALLLVFLLAVGMLLTNSITGLSAPMVGGQTAPTPAPQNGQPGSTPGGSPIIGVVVLLAPFIFLIWKSRGKKQPEIKGASCLPVIDESKHPFQILEDENPSDKSK